MTTPGAPSEFTHAFGDAVVGAVLAVVPEDVVHPGLLGGWVVLKPPVPRRTPDEVAR
jgi:hypothetical protein